VLMAQNIAANINIIIRSQVDALPGMVRNFQQNSIPSELDSTAHMLLSMSICHLLGAIRVSNVDKDGVTENFMAAHCKVRSCTLDSV
jgi:hypothetical protein